MSTGWHLAAPLYKLTIPNDPRLGWTRHKHDFIQITMIGICFLVWLSYVVTQFTSTIELCIAAALIVVCGAFIYFNRRKSRLSLQCTELAADELRGHALKVQYAALAESDLLRDRVTDLGKELIATWLVTAMVCVYTASIFLLPKFPFLKLVIFLLPMGSLMVGRAIGNWWLDAFIDRIRKRHCVSCGYAPGGPLEVVTICPECGVILPLHYRTGPDAGSGPPFAVSPSR